MESENPHLEAELAFMRALDMLRPKFFFDGACFRGGNLDWFFPKQGRRADAQKAIDICRGCPVREECFAYSYNERIEHGIWGGSTPETRRSLWSDNLNAYVAYDSILAKEAKTESD